MEFISVSNILPFWRYAVGPSSGISPAIPYWSRRSAMSFFSWARRELPWMGVRVYRRVGWREYEVIEEFVPSETIGGE